MSSSNRRVLLLGALAALGACGFTPAYGPQGGAQSLQGQVGLADPSDRANYLLNQRLEERFGRAGTPRFVLELALDTEENALGITRDGRTTRYHLVGEVDYVLRDAGTAAALTEGTTKGFTAYSATGSTVATLAAERDAEARLMVLLADQIVDRLILAAPGLPS